MSNGATTFAIALGANLGDRRASLLAALHRLTDTFGPLVISTAYETDPVGVTGPQPRFLNMAAVGCTAFDAEVTLAHLLRIEQQLGRERPFPGAARTIDLDLILFGDQSIDRPGLRVPHPRFRERLFVLEPLAEVGADLGDPTTGKSVGALLRELRAGRT